MINRVFLLIILLSGPTLIAQDLPGLRVNGRYLFDKYGEKIILRGTNMLGLFWDRYGEVQLPEIAKTGANCCRIFWMTGHPPEPHIPASALDSTIQICINNKMIPMLGLWDTTGDWDELQTALEYWTSEEVVDVIKKHEEYLLVNIGNEAGNRDMGSTEFCETYSDLVQQMRTAGIHTPLVIDADRWGRNGYTLYENGPYLLEQDPDSNLIFSWHLWDPNGYATGTKAEIKSILDNAVAANICFIVGEFGPYEFNDKTEWARIEWEYLIDQADSMDTGWLAWVWWDPKDDEEESAHSIVNQYTKLYGDWINEPWSTTIVERIATTSIRPQSILDLTNLVKSPRSASRFQLNDNYPNPFNPSTTINYELQMTNHVEVSIYNVIGQKVITLVSEVQSAGLHQVKWDGRDGYGRIAPTGIYFTQLSQKSDIGLLTKTGKMVLTK
jgi:mannan endo-1,4-beta-mannosidase